jgi:hypothetical protein
MCRTPSVARSLKDDGTEMPFQTLLPQRLRSKHITFALANISHRRQVLRLRKGTACLRHVPAELRMTGRRYITCDSTYNVPLGTPKKMLITKNLCNIF